MFGKRPDGRAIRNVDPIQKIMPYIMKERNDAMTMYEETFPCEPMDAYIREKAAEGIKMNYMHVLIAATVRLIAQRPRLNRFVVNGRFYARNSICMCIAVHPTLQDGSADTNIKLEFEGTETILEVTEKLNEAIRKETVDRQEENGTDKLARALTFVPAWLIKLLVNTLMWMDKHGILPKAIIDLSPFHTSFFITNLKSLGIRHVFHHIYNFGTTGMFLAMGKEKMIPVVKDGEVVQEKHMSFGLVSDERICDGLYYALSLRQLRKILKDPAVLEEPLEKKAEDVR